MPVPLTKLIRIGNVNIIVVHEHAVKTADQWVRRAVLNAVTGVGVSSIHDLTAAVIHEAVEQSGIALPQIFENFDPKKDLAPIEIHERVEGVETDDGEFPRHWVEIWEWVPGKPKPVITEFNWL